MASPFGGHGFQCAKIPTGLFYKACLSARQGEFFTTEAEDTEKSDAGELLGAGQAV